MLLGALEVRNSLEVKASLIVGKSGRIIGRLEIFLELKLEVEVMEAFDLIFQILLKLISYVHG